MLTTTVKGTCCHPTLYSRRLSFREIQSIAQVTQLKVMGSESQESPLSLPSCLPLKKKSHFYFQEILSNRKHKCLRKKQGRRGQSVEKRFAWTSGRRKSSEGDAVGFSVGVRFKMLNKQGSRVRNQGCQ